MVALFLIPVYLLINFYVLRWTMRWMISCNKHFKSKTFRISFIILFFLFSTTPLTSFLIKTEPLHRFLKVTSNLWFGIFLYAILCIITADLIRIIIKHTKLTKNELFRSRKLFILSGTLTIIAILAFSIHGILNARNLRMSSYDITVDKHVSEHSDLKVVLVADLHLGYSIGEWHMKNMVNKINKQNPDLVVMAGDIFDNEFDAIKNHESIEKTLAGIKSTYGVYATFGNHDLDEAILAGFTFSSKNKKSDDSRMLDFFKKSNITLLNDETVLIDDRFYLIGRKDYSRAKKVDGSRLSAQELTQDLDHSKPIFVIDHQPKEYQELADAGVDIDFSGHTHDGQMFPGNLTIKLMWENTRGYLKRDNMHTIVTSGVGVWGPNMRVGTKSEIVVVDVVFK